MQGKSIAESDICRRGHLSGVDRVGVLQVQKRAATIVVMTARDVILLLLLGQAAGLLLIEPGRFAVGCQQPACPRPSGEECVPDHGAQVSGTSPL